MSRYHVEAEKMLRFLITHQPNLASFASEKGSGPNGTDGGKVADFCGTFIQKYSVHLEEMAKSQTAE